MTPKYAQSGSDLVQFAEFRWLVPVTPFTGVMWREHSEIPAVEFGLSGAQAAQALGVSLGTIGRWSDLGYLESYRTASGQRRYSQERIEGFISLLEHQHVDHPLADRRLG
jgi:hypothetical protein